MAVGFPAFVFFFALLPWCELPDEEHRLLLQLLLRLLMLRLQLLLPLRDRFFLPIASFSLCAFFRVIFFPEIFALLDFTLLVPFLGSFLMLELFLRLLLLRLQLLLPLRDRFFLPNVSFSLCAFLGVTFFPEIFALTSFPASLILSVLVSFSMTLELLPSG